ncbi:MAG: glycoside hydrolase family protein [Micavibrio sp.]
MKKSGFFLALMLGLFLTVLCSPDPAAAQGGCYYTAQDDYICENFTPTTSTTPPPTTGTPPPAPPPTATEPTPKPSTPCTAGADPYEDFKKHLMVREGYRTKVYRDSLGKPTVGVGHLVLPGDNLKVGDVISEARVQEFLDKDARGAWNAAQSQAAEAGITDTCFIIALASVNFQLGTGWTKKFPSTWNMIKSGKYLEAANALNGTLWQRQTPVRVQDFQKALRDLDAKKKAAAAGP